MGGSAGCMDVSAKSQPWNGSASKDLESAEEGGGRSKYRSRLIILISLVLIGVSVWAVLIEDPQFSVQLTGLAGLDPSGSSMDASPTFNLTIHVDNRNDIRRFCRIALFYDHLAVGWGELPAFCVGKWSTMDLNVSLTHGGVFLSQRLREIMATDMHVGELELGVELKQIHPEAAPRACFQSCAVRLREIASPCKRSCLGETIR